MAKKRNRITAAMSATIAETSPLIKKVKLSQTEQDSTNSIIDIKLNELQDNPFQPRIDINIQSLNELISSIEQNGLLQPITITDKKINGAYIIIAGHRRYEAFKIMGKETIKAIMIKDVKDKDLAILSLTENLMREDLHPIENAIAIKNILDQNIVESQNKLAEYVGLSKGYVSKLMNILKLPTSFIALIKQENYKNVNVLLLLNKIPDTNLIFEAYTSIKELSRAEAEKYIKTVYLSEKEISKNIAEVKTTKTKISLNVNIKELTDSQKKSIQDKVNKLNEEIQILSSNWMN